MGVEPTGAGITDAHTVLKLDGPPSTRHHHGPLSPEFQGFHPSPFHYSPTILGDVLE